MKRTPLVRKFYRMKRKPIKRGTGLNRKSVRSILLRECDKLFSLYIRNRDKVCQVLTCNKTNLHCAHIFSRRNINLRWYPDNALALCYYHHLHWAHKEPILFTEFIKRKLGERRFNKLLLKKNIIETIDIKLVIAWLKDENKRR